MKRSLTTTSISLLSVASVASVQFLTAPTSEAAVYSPKAKSIYVNGKLLTKPYGIVSGGTTYMPIWYVMQLLKQLDITTTWDGTKGLWDIAAPPYMPTDLTNVAKASGSSSIKLNGKAVYKVNRIVFTEPGSHTPTTYMPIWYIMQLLNRLGIGSEWNGSTWKVTTPPAMSSTVADPSDYPTLRYSNDGYPVVLLQQKLNAAGFNVGTIDGQFGSSTQIAVQSFQSSAGLTSDGIVGQQTWLALNQQLSSVFTQPNLSTPSTQSVATTQPVGTTTQPGAKKTVLAWVNTGASITDAERNTVITQMNNDNYTFNADGTVNDSTYGTSTLSNLMAYGQNNNVMVFATVANINPTSGNFDGAFTSTLLNNSAVRATLEKNLVNAAVTKGYKGIDLDFENVKPADKSVFTQFISELAGQLHNAGKQLSVTVPAKTGATSEPWNGAYDYPSIGNLADVVPIMAYDFSWQGSNPGAIAPLYWDDQILKYATSVISKDKILLGLAAYGYDWNTTTGGYASAWSLSKVDSIISQYSVTPSWDSTDASPFFTYIDTSGNSHTVYYENQASIQQKLQLASQYGVSGVAFWKAGLENQAFLDAVQLWSANQ